MHTHLRTVMNSLIMENGRRFSFPNMEVSDGKKVFRDSRQIQVGRMSYRELSVISHRRNKDTFFVLRKKGINKHFFGQMSQFAKKRAFELCSEKNTFS